MIIFLLLSISPPKLPDEIGNIARYGVDKVVHFLMFFSLPVIQLQENKMVFTKYKQKLRVWIFVVWGIALSGITEIYQDLIPGNRYGSFTDFFANIAGIGSAFLLFRYIQKIFSKNWLNRN